MDAMQFLRGVDDPTAPYTLPHLGLVPDYVLRMQGIPMYAGQSEAQIESSIYARDRAEFDRLELSHRGILNTWIASRLAGGMYENVEELSYALGRPVDLLIYYRNASSDELFAQQQADEAAQFYAERAAQQEADRLAAEAERAAIAESQRLYQLEAQRLVAETAARDAARTAQLIAQSEARLRDEVRQQWPTGDVDRQITLYEQLRTQPPRSDAEVQSIIRDAIGDGAEFQLLMRYINNWRAGIEPAETFRQIQIEQAEAEQYERLAPIREARAQAQAQLQYLAETGLVPVDIMIETGAWSQEQIEIARQVQADRLAKEQAAFQAEIDRQDAERSARVQAEIAQAAAAEAERVRLYIADQQAQAQARYNAEQAALEAERARVAAARAAFEQEQAAAAQAQAAAAQAAEAAAIKRSVDEAAARAAAQRDLDALAEAQAIQQIVNESIAQTAVSNFLPGASLMTFNLPADWDSYFPDDKIIWFNANQITPSQLIAAGVSAADIAWMQANGYVVRDIVAAPEVESMRPKSVDDFKSYVQDLAASDMPKRLALSSVYQYFMNNFTNGQNFSMPDLIAWLRSRPAFGDGAVIVILGKYAFDGLTNSEVFLRIVAETGLAPKSIDEVEMLMGVDVVPGAELPFVVVEEPSRQIVAPEVITTPAAPSDRNASIPTTPSMPVTKPATPPQPAAGAGAVLLALASLYFLGS